MQNMSKKEPLSNMMVMLPLMGAACLYAWSNLIGSLSALPQSESLWSIVVPLIMAFFWRLIERPRVRCGLALVCMILGVAVTLIIAFGEGASVTFGVHVRQGVNAAMLILWCWVYGKLPIARSAMVFGGMQLGACLLAMLFRLLPQDTYSGLALTMPVFCFILFVIAQREVCTGEASSQGVDLSRKNAVAPLKEHLRLGVDLRWKMLTAAFLCAIAFGLVKVGDNAWYNIASFGCSGVLLIGAATFFRNKASTQSIFNVALPLIVTGLAVAAIVGSGAPLLAEFVTGIGYALMMALFTIILADRCYRFGVSAIWSIGIIRAVLGAGRFIGSSLVAWTQTAPFYESFIPIGAMFAVLVASIIWMQDSYSVTKDLFATHKNGATLASQKRDEFALTGSSQDVLESTNAIKQHLLSRCEEVAQEYCLSAREKEVLSCLAFGWSVARIEEKLVISNSTAKTHVRHIYSKLGIHSRDELKILLGVDAF